jgi:hypothetical protein
MNAKFLGEGLLVLVCLAGLGTALSSGFTNAGDATTAMPMTQDIVVHAEPLPPVDLGAQAAVNYSASGEGSFLPNGDLVGGR